MGWCGLDGVYRSPITMQAHALCCLLTDDDNARLPCKKKAVGWGGIES